MEDSIHYTFSSDKNHKLIQERGISFEEMISSIEEGYLHDIVEHPYTQKYAHQKMYVVEVNRYIYLVPFITEENGLIFLKTIIPSRKAKKKYLKEMKDYDDT
jgi:uncharacterized DUF497 family protein